jgi:hypothetical protein
VSSRYTRRYTTKPSDGTATATRKGVGWRTANRLHEAGHRCAVESGTAMRVGTLRGVISCSNYPSVDWSPRLLAKGDRRVVLTLSDPIGRQAYSRSPCPTGCSADVLLMLITHCVSRCGLFQVDISRLLRYRQTIVSISYRKPPGWDEPYSSNRVVPCTLAMDRGVWFKRVSMSLPVF